MSDPMHKFRNVMAIYDEKLEEVRYYRANLRPTSDLHEYGINWYLIF